MNHKDTIEINGKLYDASTGHLLHAQDQPEQVTSLKIEEKPAPKRQHQVASHIKHHEPVRSQTLMRHAVKSPSAHAQSPRRDNVKSYKPGISRHIVTAQALHQRKAATHTHAAAHVPQSRQVFHFSAVHTRNHYVENSILRAEEKIEATIQEVPATISKASALLDKALKEAKSHEEPLLPRSQIIGNNNKYHIFNKLRIDRVSL
jgi:hypothetical protein